MSNNKTYPNESAFPELQEVPQFNSHSYGLTKREYFATMAMQGILSSDINSNLSIGTVTEYAVRQADSLIKALNNEQQ